MPLFSDFAFPIAAEGAVPRPMEERLTDVINVMEFGAIPSGSALSDNRSAFEKAIAAATPAWLDEGVNATGLIKVPRGMYNFLGPVELPSGGFTLTGEGAGCTFLLGSFNGYILDMGEEEVDEGGFIVEQFKIINSNATPFTSGCIRMRGMSPTVRSCVLGGMVMVNFTGAKAPAVRDTFFGGSLESTPGEGSIGVLYAGDGGVCENNQGSQMDVFIALSGSGQSVHGCHCEVSRRLIVTGYGFNGYGSSAGPLGLGYTEGASVQGQPAEGVAIALDIAGPTRGSFAGIGGQMHQGPGINPDPDSDYPDRAKWAVRIQDGMALGVQIIGCNGSTADLVDPTGGLYYIGMPPEGHIRTGGAYIFGASDAGLQQAGWSPDDTWTLPGSAGGGAAVAGAANCAKFDRCTRVPIWQYDDLPWGTLVGATISGTTVAYSSATRLTPEEGMVLKGTGVTPGTKVISVNNGAKTAVVDTSQTVASTTMTFFCNNPGDTYIISDSVDPLWTGTSSNAGKPVVGGGAEQVNIAFNEIDGCYKIVG